jgi:glycosyltransferase involved in cell wall biosynthesis
VSTSPAFRVCALVPTYDNPRTIRDTVEAIRAHVGEVLVVDDGSGPKGRAACDAIAAECLAHVERRAANGGKGAAVKTGFTAALARGYTHAFQVDADGQHDIRCMPAFLEAARRQPEALVLGHPVYDASVPRGRVAARRITSFCVTLELGRADHVIDAMVGFRVYPLRAALGARARSDRMDFDIEIAVRMARAGTPVINLPVGVRYVPAAEGGVSHFQPLLDNLRFFRVHSRLCTSGALGWARRAIGGGRR